MGHYIAFEGLECCGKSTLIREVADQLRLAQWRVEDTRREPGQVRMGADMYRALNTLPAVTDEERLLLTFAERCGNREGLERSISQYDFVLTDRCYLSAMVYQRKAFGGRGAEIIYNLVQPIEPDLVVYCDCTYAQMVDRLSWRKNKPDVIETSLMNIQSFCAARQAYMDQLSAYSARRTAAGKPSMVFHLNPELSLSNWVHQIIPCITALKDSQNDSEAR